MIIWVGGKQAVTQTFSRRKDAEEFEREQKRRLERGEGLLDVSGSKESVAVWADRYVDLRTEVAPATRKREDSLLRTHVLPAFGNLPVRLLVRSKVQRWVNDLTQRRSPSTARLALGVLRAVVQVAVDDRALAVNPVAKIVVHGVAPGKPRVVSHEQIASLVNELAAPRDKALVLLLAYMGLRWGEATALVWSDFSADGFIVSVDKAYRRGEDTPVELGPTKTHQRRVVPVPEFVRAQLMVLWAQRFEHGAERSVWPAVGKRASVKVFVTSAGTELSNGNFRNRVLSPASKRAGIAPAVTPHQLRDSYASLSVAAGASVAAVSRNLGHGQVTTTLRHYVDALPTERAAVAVALSSRAVDAALSGPAPLPLPEDSGGSGKLTAD